MGGSDIFSGNSNGMEEELVREQLLEKTGELRREEGIINELIRSQELTITKDMALWTILCC